MSEIVEQTPDERLLAPPQGASLPFKSRLLKSYVDFLGKTVPSTAGRRATDIFGYTRTFNKKPPKDVTPLGARRFAIKDVPGVTHGYLWGESEKTILLVHGWGADSSSMYSFVRALQKKNYRVAAFDAPSHGVSPGTLTTMTAFKNAVRGAINSLGGVDGIVAHSLGCLSSIAALSDMPGVRPVQSMCLLAPPCTLPAVIKRWSNGFLQLNDQVMREMYAELGRRNSVPVEYWNITTLGKQLETPLLVLHDPQDTVVPFCESEQIAKSLAIAKLELAPKSGHVRILSDARVVERVAQFLFSNGVEVAAPVAS